MSTSTPLAANSITAILDHLRRFASFDRMACEPLLRLRIQHQRREAGSDLSNRVDPDTLNDLDRRILKEAFRQARKLQATLEKYFQF